MSDNEKSRLDRIEELIQSNARAIEALANERRVAEQEISRDRARLYQTMADLASAQASFYQVQAGFYHRLEEVDQRQTELSRRQGEIVEILKLLTQNKNSSNN